MVKHHFAASSTYKAKQFDLAALGFASDTGAFWGHTSSAMIRNRLTDLILHARYAVPLFIYGFECSSSALRRQRVCGCGFSPFLYRQSIFFVHSLGRLKDAFRKA